MSYFTKIPKLSGLSIRACVPSSLDNTMTPSLGCKTCNRWYTKPPADPPPGTATRKADSPGALREAPGGLGRFGTVQEEAYFMAKQKEELKNIKKNLKEPEGPDLKQKK